MDSRNSSLPIFAVVQLPFISILYLVMLKKRLFGKCPLCM